MPDRLSPQNVQWFFIPYQQPRAASKGSITGGPPGS